MPHGGDIEKEATQYHMVVISKVCGERGNTVPRGGDIEICEERGNTVPHGGQMESLRGERQHSTRWWSDRQFVRQVETQYHVVVRWKVCEERGNTVPRGGDIESLWGKRQHSSTWW